MLLFLITTPLFSAYHNARDLVAKDEKGLFNALYHLAEFNKSDIGDVLFEDVLAQNCNLKLDSYSKQSLAEAIIMNRINKSGAQMLVALRRYQGIDYNLFKITTDYKYPLVLAAEQMLDDCENGIHVVNALIDCGANTEIEGCCCPTQGNVRKCWMERAVKDLMELSDKKNQEEKAQEAADTIRFINQEKVSLDELLVPSLQVYVALQKGKVPADRSRLTTRKQLKEVRKKKEHVCSCTYCGLPFM